MAPILKEADAPATTATTTATTPASPASKSPNETPTRPQPVPLEIPVTVNGARTVEGSDKREPFAETTQTVLVFPHGAVIRIATMLAPGQLVFLTNEKTKKEVVCQVVKSKSGGSASGYVELQFTEPAPAFWGLRLPGVAAPPATAPAVSRPASASPAAPKVVSPAPPAAKIPAPAPVGPPAAQAPAPPKLAIAPPAPPAPLAKSEPPAPKPVAPSLTAPPVLVLPPPSAPKLPEPAPVQSAPVNTPPAAPLVSVPPPPPLTSGPLSPSIHKAPKPLIPTPAGPPRDYSKEIESLFAVPQAPVPAPPKAAAPVAPPPPTSPAASSPSSEELKLHAARLQEQLSSLLFTDAPATAPKSSVPPAELKPKTPVADAASKILEIVHKEPNTTAKPDAKVDLKSEPKPEVKPVIKPVIKLDPKPASPPRIPVFSSLNAKDEEVAIPAWLHPLSQHSETVVQESAPAVEATEVSSSEPVTAETPDSEIFESSSRSEAAVFGGQLLSGEASAETTPAARSKKGLFLGLAAAVLLAGAGAWYYRQAPPSVATPQTTKSSVAPLTAGPVATTTSSPAPAAPSRPAANSPAASTPTNSTPARNSAPPPVTSSPAPSESRNDIAARNPAPLPETPQKPALGEVRLATPVVKGSAESPASTESLPSIDSTVDTSSADALAAAAHRKGPTAPLPIGGDVKPAQLIKSVPPVYPQMAKTQRVTGNVTLDALIDTSGNVAELKVLSGPSILHRAALDAVKQWKYTPAQLDGAPTSMHLTVTVQFRAQ
jgi:TonB family protein